MFDYIGAHEVLETMMILLDGRPIHYVEYLGGQLMIVVSQFLSQFCGVLSLAFKGAIQMGWQSQRSGPGCTISFSVTLAIYPAMMAWRVIVMWVIWLRFSLYREHKIQYNFYDIRAALSHVNQEEQMLKSTMASRRSMCVLCETASADKFL